MPLSVYESLVKEYLESKGYIVYENLIFTSSRKEIDILAFSPRNMTALVGEVKSNSYRSRDVIKFAKKSNSPELSVFLSKRYGVDNFRKFFFCWNLYNKEKDVKDSSRGLGIDEVVTFPEVVSSLLHDVTTAGEKFLYDVNRPNTVLLQIIVDALSNKSKHLTIASLMGDITAG